MSQTLLCLEHFTLLLGVFLRRGQTKGLGIQDPRLTVRKRTGTDNVIPLPYRLMCSRRNQGSAGYSRVCVELPMRLSSPRPLGPTEVRPDLRSLH